MSTEFYFPSRTSQRWLRVGPLAGDLERFATRLKAQGYARPTAVSKLRLVGNLSCLNLYICRTCDTGPTMTCWPS